MTGVAGLYCFLRQPNSNDARTRLKAFFRGKHDTNTRFVVLSWNCTGANLLYETLYNHPETLMHNELFNPVRIFSRYPNVQPPSSNDERASNWTYLSRDLDPQSFLSHIWSGCNANGREFKQGSKAIGFMLFPDHWPGKSENVWRREIMEDYRVKKIIFHRENEVAVYVAMKQSEIVRSYTKLSRPEEKMIHIDPASFQAFIHDYRDTFWNKYNTPNQCSDTFRLSYEQLADEENFDNETCPRLWRFLGVDERAASKRLPETLKQSASNDDHSKLISNLSELEFCFRHTDVKCFSSRTLLAGVSKELQPKDSKKHNWSILLPICSRGASSTDHMSDAGTENLARSSRCSSTTLSKGDECWGRLERFASSLKVTSSTESLLRTTCIVGIDEDDPIFFSDEAKQKIRGMIPTKIRFVSIKPIMYGYVCRIWNHLANCTGQNDDFIVLLGDDIELLTENWQTRIESRFHLINQRTGLPFGAACVAFNDESFPGFPTFPVIHRWHVEKFGRLLPEQFVNQGGDPYLYELYSRWNASSFEMSCRLKNTLGGDCNARYEKCSINWPGQILTPSLTKLQGFLGHDNPAKGICLDVIVPSYRRNNQEILARIMSLRASIQMNVKFWIVVDNTDETHLAETKELATNMNGKRDTDGNYFVSVIHYGENRGASFARNFGYNFSTADWVLFLDDDVIPSAHILDAYAGAVFRHPEAKIFVGNTVLPEPCNLWTEILSTSNVMYFFGISRHRVHPPWGVTANLLVRGSRFNHTIQFKGLYPKTGGGEDIDFVFQMKEWYGRKTHPTRVVVSVQGAEVTHPWWRQGKVCYGHIMGWAWGDSMCIGEWPEKTYCCFPNWVECIVFVLPLVAYTSGNTLGTISTMLIIGLLDHLIKISGFLPCAWDRTNKSFFRSILLSLGASTVISSQEVTRVAAMIVRQEFLFSFGRRMDWFDGQEKTQVLDIQRRSAMIFLVYVLLCYYSCGFSLDS